MGACKHDEDHKSIDELQEQSDSVIDRTTELRVLDDSLDKKMGGQEHGNVAEQPILPYWHDGRYREQ